MSQANFARMHRTPAADEPRGRNAVMRAAEGPMPCKQSIDVLAQDRMNAQRLLLILERKLGQNARHAPRKHGLARTGRADHEQAELAGGRKRHATFGDLLPQNVGIIELGLKGRLEHFRIQIMPCGIAHAMGKLR